MRRDWGRGGLRLGLELGVGGRIECLKGAVSPDLSVINDTPPHPIVSPPPHHGQTIPMLQSPASLLKPSPYPMCVCVCVCVSVQKKNTMCEGV